VIPVRGCGVGVVGSCRTGLTAGRLSEKLENWRTSINRAGSGEELYILLLNYKRFINKNWVDDFGDPGNWKSELNQVISKVRNKVDVADIRACQDLSSYQDDARQTAHSLNHTLKYHHAKTKVLVQHLDGEDDVNKLLKDLGITG
jgi:N-glycosylase/DNA lyase